MTTHDDHIVLADDEEYGLPTGVRPNALVIFWPGLGEIHVPNPVSDEFGPEGFRVLMNTFKELIDLDNDDIVEVLKRNGVVYHAPGPDPELH